MINRIKHATVVLFMLGNFFLASAAPPEVTRFTLNNGIKVVNLYVENSTDVGIFSYLPLGLVADGKAKTQWSHLIEHLTIRTTGPIDFKTSGAETVADNMRLDFIGNTDNWTQGLKRHAQWLSGLPFSAESLAEELPNALSEIDATEMRLATHKWAFAAWNQVFRHGETAISMRGDVQSAQLSELQEYRDLHLVQADRVLLCVIGGVKSGNTTASNGRTTRIYQPNDKNTSASNSNIGDGERPNCHLGYQCNPLHGNLRDTQR